MLYVEQLLGLVTVQDGGRFGHRHAGVPVGGALDRGSWQLANALVGNAADAVVLEGCLAALTLRVDAPVTVALTGAVVEATLNGRPLSTGVVDVAEPGALLRIVRATQGALWYLALRGGLDVPRLLNGRGTVVSAGLGPPRLQRGATLRVGTQATDAVRAGVVPRGLRTPLDDGPLPWLPGTRLDVLDSRGWQQFFSRSWRVAALSDRSGYRLEGDPLPMRPTAAAASEPTCVGAMQLPPDGRPIVLMAEAPTVGGYPVIGVVPPLALDALAQRPPGASVSFVPTTPDEVLAEERARADAWAAWCRRG
jgi:biotin-dependent carboxylase-like uncharacterized protein